jgi:hypothetical protein
MLNKDIDTTARGLGGLTITLKVETIFGETIEVPVKTKADGSFSFDELPPGTATIRSAQPIFLQQGVDLQGSQGATVEVTATGETILHIDLSEGTNGLGNTFSEVGRKPEYYSVRDFLNTTPRKSVMFAANTTSGQHWFAFREGWENIVDGEFTISADRSTIFITAVHTSGQIYTATVATAGNYRVEWLGQIGSSYLVRLAGGFGDYAFQPVAPVEGEFSMTGFTAPSTGDQSEMEGEYLPQAGFVPYTTTNGTSSSQTSAVNPAYDAGQSAVDEALADYDYFTL